MQKSWKRLAIDTATKYVYLSLVIDNQEVDTVYEEGINNHSVTVIPLISSILDRHALTLKDINEVIVGIGPGSYTGVRIGVAIVKMIGYLNEIPIQTVSSLALIASASDKEVVVPVIDARRENAFMACFSQKKGILRYLEEDELVQKEEFLSKHCGDCEIVSEGVPKIEKLIQSDLLTTVDDIHALVPNYLQVTEAERKKAKQ